MSKGNVYAALTFMTLYVCLWLAAILGWTLNIIKLFGLDFSGPVTVELIVRIVGVIAFPIGIIYGYF